MSTYTYNKILSKGIEADLPAQVKEGKLRFTTDTKKIFLDTDGQRIEFSDFIKGKTESQIKGILAPLPKFYLASDTQKLWYYDTGWKVVEAGATTYVEESGHSVNADTATYAINAGTASYSTNSGTATYATNAGSATSATNASTAQYAVNAGSATNASTAAYATNSSTAQYAKNAGTSNYATNASTSDYATNSGTATYAINAGSATSATNASTANYATNAGSASNATSATNASTAAYATVAGKATNDGSGNSISGTYAPKNSPTFTGTPTVPNAATTVNNTQIANTSFVHGVVDAAIAGVTQFDYEVVTTLPTTGVKGKIYLVAVTGPQTQNIYDEYIWIGDKYEKLGTTQLDLSNYVNATTVTGTGNAITSVSKSGNTITFTKGSTFLTGHPAVPHNSSTASATPAAGNNIDVITDITTDNFGHASSFVKTTVTLPNSVANATNADTATYATSAGSVAWNNVSSKPTTFAPIVGSASTQAAAGNHNHDGTYYKKTDTVNNASTAAYSADVPSWAKASSKPTYTKSEVGLGNVANLDQSKAISSIIRSGNTFTATALDGTTSSFTQKDDNSTYALTTGTTNGTVNFNANGTTTDVAVKGLAALAYKASLGKADVGLGNVDNTADANKNVASAVNASTADYAKNGISNITRSGLNFTVTKADGSTFGFDQQDMNTTYTKSSLGLGNVANLDQSKAIKTITRNGLTFTATALDGTTSSFTQQDTNTTYANMTSAAAGLAPAGGSGTTKYLRQDGSWQVPPDNNTTYGNVSTATAGLAPKVTNTAGFLKGDGTWGTPGDTTYSLVSTAANGLAPKITNTSGYLRGDGTWAVPPNTTYANMTSAAAGLAPASGGGTTKYLRADGSWQVPPDNNTTYDLSPYAPKASPAFTGTPTTPDVATGDNSTKIANTKFVTSAITTAIAGVTQFDYEVVTTLPTTGVKGKIYLVTNSSSVTQNIYDEYIWIGDKYEKLGTTQIDLSNYVNATTVTGTGNAITNVSKSGNTITFTKGTTFPTTNTTYAVVSTAANGLAPKVTDTNKYLKGDGTWATPTNTTYANMTSAAAGLAPAGGSGTTKYLRQDGSWQVPPDNNTTYGSFTSAAAGLAPASGGGTSKYLRADGSWVQPPNTTYAVVSTAANGLAPKVTDTNKYLKGDGTWATPTNTTYSGTSGRITLSGTTFDLATTGTAGTYGPSANVTGSNGATIAVPQITTDAYGRVTSVTNRTYTSVNTDTDTKNTAGSTDTSSKIFLIGATSQAANPQTYSDNEVYATSGVLTAKSMQVGGGAATIQYNSNTQSIDFVFAS